MNLLSKSLAGAALITATSLSANAASLTIVAENVEKAKGNVIVAVYKGDKFLSKAPEDRAYDGWAPAEKGPVKITIDNIEPGEYGFVIFHDANENQDLDTNFIGLPKEGIAFSNGAKINMGPPKIEDAAFKVDEPGTVQTVALDY